MPELDLHIHTAYAREDLIHLKDFRKYTKDLERRGVRFSDDRDIGPGDDWDETLLGFRNTADIIVTLLSANFIASDYCMGVELGHAMQRRDEGFCLLFPAYVGPYDINGDARLQKIQRIPSSPAITEAPDQVRAWVNVAGRLRETAEGIMRSRQQANLVQSEGSVRYETALELTPTERDIPGTEERIADTEGQRWPALRRALSGTGRRIILIAVALLLIGGGTVTWLATGDTRPFYKINVFTNRDLLVLPPEQAQASTAYVTKLAISQVPKPPLQQNSCDNRYAWAHQAPISAVDADATVAKIDIASLSGTITINQAQLYLDSPQAPSLGGTLLTCPGRGGPRPPNDLEIDLGTGTKTFYPNGGDVPADMNLDIAQGTSETLIVIGSTEQYYCRWRLELTLERAGSLYNVTIGPTGAMPGLADVNKSQPPFETTGSLASTPYQFKNGQWQPGR